MYTSSTCRTNNWWIWHNTFWNVFVNDYLKIKKKLEMSFWMNSARTTTTRESQTRVVDVHSTVQLSWLDRDECEHYTVLIQYSRTVCWVIAGAPEICTELMRVFKLSRNSLFDAFRSSSVYIAHTTLRRQPRPVWFFFVDLSRTIVFLLT